MKKKPKLLTTLLSGEKRRHHVAAYVTQEGDWNQHEPNTGFARMFIAMLVLHVLIIGGIILSDSSSSAKTAPRSPAAQAILTKSANEISSAAKPSTAPSAADGEYQTYEVRSGDSLPMIVARFGVDRDELISLNGLDKDAGFGAGTVLKIPHNRVAEPLQISPVRPLASTASAPSDTTPVPESSSLVTDPTVNPDTTAASASPAAFAATTPGLGSATGLVPLPDVSSSTSSVPTPAEMTVVEAATLAADTPPSAESAPVVSKSDSVVSKPEPAAAAPAKAKTIAKKSASSPRPIPVPPPSEMKKRPITKADTPPKTTAKTADKPAAKAGGTHTMAKGETLYRLSSLYGVSIDSLIKANNIKDPAKLRDGTKLVIPAK